MGLVIDSSILIAGERGKFDLPAFFTAFSGEVFCIAAITASELLHGVERANTKDRKDARSRCVEDVLSQLPVIDFDLPAARRHAKLWATLESAGQTIGPHDLLIAATALDQGHTVATLNTAEFSRIPELSWVPVEAFVIKGKA